jgi:A/G-specific adenine glycosylase
MDDICGIQRRLLGWFETERRPLPWRETMDPYRIWISEVMLQQTQVQTVIPYYQGFIGWFPDVETLARADLGTVLKGWEGLGYYSRARNLHRAAQTLVERDDAQLPRTAAALKELPGIGDYIAAALASIAFGEPVAAVDGNVKRVLSRLLRMSEPVNQPAAYPVYRQAAERLLDRSRPGDFNQAMMELGALICRPTRPLCDTCPLQADCRVYAEGAVDAYPTHLKRRAIPTYPIAAGVVMKGDRFLITRRRTEGLLGGLWEFPGGKIGEGEVAATACAREVLEETGLAVFVAERMIRVRHAYTHFRIVMDVFRCRYQSGRVRLNGPTDFRWIGPDQIDDFAFPKANHAIFSLLRH